MAATARLGHLFALFVFVLIALVIPLVPSTPAQAASVDTLCVPPTSGDPPQAAWLRVRFISRAQIEVNYIPQGSCANLPSSSEFIHPNVPFASLLNSSSYIDNNTGDGDFDYRIREAVDNNDSFIDQFGSNLDDEARDNDGTGGADGIVSENFIRTQVEQAEFQVNLEEDSVPDVTCPDTNRNFGLVKNGDEFEWRCGTDNSFEDDTGVRFVMEDLDNFNITYVVRDGNIVHVSPGQQGTRTFRWCETEYRTGSNCEGDLSIQATQEQIAGISGNNPIDVRIVEDGGGFVDILVAGAESEAAAAVNLQSGGAVEASPTCESGIPGIGWIVCEVTRFFIGALDFLIRDQIVRNILQFDSLTNESQKQALEDVWGGFRTLANLGFVIAFFIVIYSATTGGLLSAYDVKKLLPKLVLGAILVQLSFFICVQLVIIFNAIGNGITDLILAPIPGDSVDVYSDTDIDFGILSGLLEGVVSILFIVLMFFAAIFAIGGILLMVVVFTLRNMALVVLTVISPLAFVAWILPNTENLFKKWWGFYIQLLALFPVAMAFLASGRLISYVWANAGGGWANEWIAIIALFAPYLVAPKMFQFAGNAVGTVVRGAQQANETLKKNTGRIRGSEFGQRTEEAAKAGAARRITARYADGSGREGTKMGRLVRSNMGQRVTAEALERQRGREDSDTKNAQVLQKEEIARRRAGVDINDAKHATEVAAGRAAGKSDEEIRGGLQDKAEIAYLRSIMESGESSNFSKRAAARRLSSVHSNDAGVSATLQKFMSDGQKSQDRQTQDVVEKIFDDNLNEFLSDMPHVGRGFDGAASQSAEKVIGAKAAAVKDYVATAGDKRDSQGNVIVGAPVATNAQVAKLASKYAEAAGNDSLKGRISDKNLTALIEGMRARGMDGSAEWAALEANVDMATGRLR